MDHRDDASVSSSVSGAPNAVTTSTSPTLPSLSNTVASTAPTALSRSVSQQSATSTRSHRSARGQGGGSRRASSRVPHGSQQQQPPPLPSSSSVTSEDSKSLTSFPSFSPKSKSLSPPRASSRPRLGGPKASTTSLVDSLVAQPLQSQQSQPQPPPLPVTAPSASTASTSTVTAAARSALFEDAPPLPSSRIIPGSLHLTDDAHIARLIGKHGAVSLVRQLAEDLALRDAQVAAVRARAAERERFLRKIVLECGLSSLDLETRLRTLEQEARVNSVAAAVVSTADSTSAPSAARQVSDLVSDAMADDNSLHQSSSDYYYNDATIRANSVSAVTGKAANNTSGNTGTTKGWKDYLFGSGTVKRSSRSSSVNSDAAPLTAAASSKQQQTAVRAASGGDRRPVITDDLFRPPLATGSDLARSASRASSVNSTGTSQSTTQSGRKASLATQALRLFVSNGSNSDISSQEAGNAGTVRGRAGTAGSGSATASLRTVSSAASRKPGKPASVVSRSSRATAVQGGAPRSIPSARRATAAAVLNGPMPQNIPGGGSGSGAVMARGQAQDRWGEMMESSPSGDGVVRRQTYVPVEMDTILPLDVQPPTLTQMYNRYNSSGHLIDRFGFIYDQRRKKRQREAAQMARQVKRGSRHSEMLTIGRNAGRASRSSPSLLLSASGGGDEDDDTAAADEHTNTNTETADAGEPDSNDSGSVRDNKTHKSGSNGHNGKPSSLVEGDERSASPAFSLDDTARDGTSVDSGREGGPPKRWQDYLKIATFPTELLAHTPGMSDSRIEVIMEGDDSASSTDVASVDAGPKSPTGFITPDRRGFVPPSTGAMAAATTAAATATTTASGLDTDSITSSTTEPARDGSSQQQHSQMEDEAQLAQSQFQKKRNSNTATLVKEDVEPVRLLLQQLSELHDTLQQARTVRWNEFLRKVRAERRREGEAAAATAVAAAESRFLRATAVMPETRIADGEIIGVAGLGNKGKLGRAKWNEFRLLVLGGIPVVLRAKVWAECTGAASLRVPGAYDDLVAGIHQPDDSDRVGAEVGPQAEAEAEVVAQIQADIYRTLTDNIFFREGPGTAKLNEVLLAYARRNPDVGYCQGMNLIAANLLLVTPSAEDAFWLLASIVETILPAGYYDHSLAASRADQQVLRRYVAEVLPRLSAHFDALAIDLETMTFQWFLSVFTDCLSAEALFRVWDVVFCLGDGSVFLFQVALALLKLNEAQLLRCDTPAEVYTYINHQMTNHAISIDGLIQASEALRKLVRRDDVEQRRAAAMDAERALVAARAAAVEEAKASRRQKLEQKAAAAAAAAAVAEQTSVSDNVGAAVTAASAEDAI